MQTLRLPKGKFPQGNEKATSAQCFTGLPWLRPLSPLLKMAPYARLHKPVFSAYKLFQHYQEAFKIKKNDPTLTLQVPPLPQTFLHWHKESGLTFKLEKVNLNPQRRRFSGVPLALRTRLLQFLPV